MNADPTKSRLRNPRQGILKAIVMALAITLLLVACERPLQTAPDDGYPAPLDAETPTDAAPVEGEPAEEPAATPTAANGPDSTPTDSAPAVTEESATPEEEDDESPRTNEEEAPPPDDEATPEPTAEATGEATAEPTPEPTAEATEETGSTEERTHVVQAGENLYRIGLQYGVSWTVLAEYNNIANPNRVEVGQQIRIPPTEGAAPDATPAPSVTHVVQAGETLFIISQHYGVSWPDIAEANNLAPPYTIHTGQELTIPGGG